MKINTTLHPIHQVYDGIFNSYSGVQIDLKEPTADMIMIEDVAMGLNNICRFGGQIPEFYSVLKHSLLVYALAPVELAAVALVHDAAEAYLGDVIKPIKVMIGRDYQELERNFQRVIFQKLSLDEKLMAKVKPYDNQALQMEHDHFFNIRKSPFKNILEMFEQHDPTQRIFIPCQTNWIDVYTELLFSYCPDALANETKRRAS